MRSIAVLCVVVSHATVYLGHPEHARWLGITGVCFFFVHTSLVLMFSLERDPAVSSFYLRRIFRIYPLWLVMVAIISGARVPQFPPEYAYRHANLVGLLSNITLTFNLLHREEIVGAGWTLPIEVDMYLFLPALFFFVRSVKTLWPLLVLDAFVVVFNHQSFGQTSFFPMCVPCFLPGVLAYVLWNRSNRVLPGWTFPLLLAVLIGWNQRYGSWQHNWLSCLVLGFALPHFRELSFDPVKKAAHVIAKYSYGIYLTHITALVVAVHAMRNKPPFMRIAVFAFLVTVPAVLLYHCVEEPMIRLGASLARRLRDRQVPRINEAILNTEPAP